jgi:hypothetical protein
MNDYNDTQMNVKHPPYNTGKVVIGKYHERYEPCKVSDEDEFWQGVLLNRPSFMTGDTKRFWLGYAIVMCMLVVLFMGALK